MLQKKFALSLSRNLTCRLAQAFSLRRSRMILDPLFLSVMQGPVYGAAEESAGPWHPYAQKALFSWRLRRAGALQLRVRGHAPTRQGQTRSGVDVMYSVAKLFRCWICRPRLVLVSPDARPGNLPRRPWATAESLPAGTTAPGPPALLRGPEPANREQVELIPWGKRREYLLPEDRFLDAFLETVLCNSSGTEKT